MSKSYRRFETLLPLRFNDGRAIPNELVAETLEEIQDQFGAVSSESQTIRGLWRHEGQTYRDESVRLFVDAPDSPEHLKFIQDFKERLKARFGQIEIWVTSYPIQLL